MWGFPNTGGGGVVFLVSYKKDYRTLQFTFGFPV